MTRAREREREEREREGEREREREKGARDRERERERIDRGEKRVKRGTREEINDRREKRDKNVFEIDSEQRVSPRPDWSRKYVFLIGLEKHMSSYASRHNTV